MTYKVNIIDPCVDQRWDEFVKNHPLGWIVHLSGWKKVLESTFPQMRGHYFALIDQETDTIKAGLPVYEVRSWLTGNRLVSIPFATLCDPLISEEKHFTIIVDEVLNYATKINIATINIRLFQSGNIISNMEENISALYKTHQLQIQSDPEETKKTFSRNVRKIIKTFDNTALTLRLSNNETDLLIFYHLYSKTRKRLGLPTQPYMLFKYLFQIYSPQNHISLLIAEIAGKPIGGLIVFKYKKRVSSEFLASELEYRQMNTDHFLYWNAIRIACMEGYSIYDFGRTATNNSSLADFKRRWGTTEFTLPQYHNHKNYQMKAPPAFKLAKNLIKSAPAPLFQALSRFCYHHLG
jgi:lipid II:glycine glycyltransferase (peptidoglycan interpeptide bridge formation enzyme)